MIKFNKLYIDKDDTTLSIDVSVLEGLIYKDVYIDEILVKDQNDVQVYNEFLAEDTKVYTKELSALNISTSIKGSIFFVTIITRGNPSIDVPCGKDNISTTEAVYNKYPLYTKSICYMRELTNSCASHNGFADYILKITALDLAIKTKDFINAKDFWIRYFSNLNSIESIKNCGCNG